MLTHPLLDKAIREEGENISRLLPARTATYISYRRGAKEALVWNEDESETKIDLPLQDGYYVPDGNPYAIPNGKPSDCKDPDALYLYKNPDYYGDYHGPIVRGLEWLGMRGVNISGHYSTPSGVALIQGRNEMAGLSDPKALLQRAEQLESAAKELTESMGAVLSEEAYARLIKPTLDEAVFLRELAGKTHQTSVSSP